MKQVRAKVAVTNSFNSDQSGFQLQIINIDYKFNYNRKDKKMKCVVQSVSSTTHSYAIQPLISADGKLLSPPFLDLKEPTGKFGSMYLGQEISR